MKRLMLYPKLFIFGAVLIPAVAIGWLQRQNARATNQHMQQGHSELDRLQRQIKATRALTEAHTAMVQQRQDRQKDLEYKLARAASRSSTHPNIPGDTGKKLALENPPYVTLSKTNLNQFNIEPFTDDFHLTDEAAALLGMSSNERQAVDHAVTQLITKHEQLDLAKAKQVEEHLTSDPGRKTTFKVPAYPEEGKTLSEAALGTVTKTLGPERTRLLMQYSDLNSLSADGFEPFGRCEKKITFLDRLDANGQRGECQIYLQVVDTQTGFRLMTGFANKDDAIPKNWRHLIQNIAPGP